MKHSKTTMTPAEYRAGAKEADIQRGICQLLDLVGIPYSVTDAALTFHQGKVVGRAVTRDGFPDVVACLPPNGRLWAIETKTTIGRLRPSQVAFLNRLGDSGALVSVPRSIEDVAEVLLATGFNHQALIALTKETG